MTAARYDLIIAVAVAFFGFFVAIGTLDIETTDQLFEGAKLLPSIVFCGLVLLAAVLAGDAVMRMRNERDGKSEDQAHDWRLFLCTSAPMIALMIVYVGLLDAFGYLLGTVIVAPFIFFVFGSRRIVSTVITSTLTAIILYLIFFKGLRMFDPPGFLINLSNLF